MRTRDDAQATKRGAITGRTSSVACGGGVITRFKRESLRAKRTSISEEVRAENSRLLETGDW